MTDIILKFDARADKYGFVVVNNPDGSFNREYRITGEELAAHYQSGKGVPPGCSVEEWHVNKLANGKECAFVIGEELDVGDMRVTKNRQGVSGVEFKWSEAIDLFTGRIVKQKTFIPDDQYTGKLPNISVDAEKLPAGIVSLVDGVLTLKGG